MQTQPILVRLPPFEILSGSTADLDHTAHCSPVPRPSCKVCFPLHRSGAPMVHTVSMRLYPSTSWRPIDRPMHSTSFMIRRHPILTERQAAAYFGLPRRHYLNQIAKRRHRQRGTSGPILPVRSPKIGVPMVEHVSIVGCRQPIWSIHLLLQLQQHYPPDLCYAVLTWMVSVHRGIGGGVQARDALLPILEGRHNFWNQPFRLEWNNGGRQEREEWRSPNRGVHPQTRERE